MKKLLMLSLSILIVMSITNLNAQETNKNAKKETKTEKKELRKLAGKEVSDLSKISFKEDFGIIPNVQWARVDYFDEATFTKDGIKMKAFYDETSKLVGTTTPKKITDLPKKAQQEISSKYKDYKVGNIIFFEDNTSNESDMLLYGAQFEDADNYFVELSKDKKNIVLEVNPKGEVFFFKELK